MASHSSLHARRALIVGAGAIGCAIARQLTESHWQVDITWHRRPPAMAHPMLRVFQLDPTAEQSINHFVQPLVAEGIKYDWVINCTGLLTSDTAGPEKRLADVSAEFFIENMRVNALPTLLLAKYVSPLLNDTSAAAPAVFAVVSAKVGSISDNRLGGWYSYRASKAALNMTIKTLSIEWQRRFNNRCVVALHPGTTQSPLSKPFSKNVPTGKYFTPEQTADYLISQVQTLGSNNTGEFIAWSGERLGW